MLKVEKVKLTEASQAQLMYIKGMSDKSSQPNMKVDKMYGSNWQDVINKEWPNDPSQQESSRLREYIQYAKQNSAKHDGSDGWNEGARFMNGLGNGGAKEIGNRSSTSGTNNKPSSDSNDKPENSDGRASEKNSEGVSPVALRSTSNSDRFNMLLEQWRLTKNNMNKGCAILTNMIEECSRNLNSRRLIDHWIEFVFNGRISATNAMNEAVGDTSRWYHSEMDNQGNGLYFYGKHMKKMWNSVDANKRAYIIKLGNAMGITRFVPGNDFMSMLDFEGIEVTKNSPLPGLKRKKYLLEGVKDWRVFNSIYESYAVWDQNTGKLLEAVKNGTSIITIDDFYRLDPSTQKHFVDVEHQVLQHFGWDWSKAKDSYEAIFSGGTGHLVNNKGAITETFKRLIGGNISSKQRFNQRDFDNAEKLEKALKNNHIDLDKLFKDAGFTSYRDALNAFGIYMTSRGK